MDDSSLSVLYYELLGNLRADDYVDEREEVDRDLQQLLWNAFGTVMGNCTTIRRVIELGELYNENYPKESFLVVLVRDAIMSGGEGLLWRSAYLIAIDANVASCP